MNIIGMDVSGQVTIGPQEGLGADQLRRSDTKQPLDGSHLYSPAVSLASGVQRPPSSQLRMKTRTVSAPWLPACPWA